MVPGNGGHAVVMLLRRSSKRAAHRLLGDETYAALQSRYWRSRLRRLSYPYEFRDEIAATVSPGDTVLDVGANVGQYAALLAGMVGPEGRVIAFEPAPRTFRILGSVIAGLGLSNVDTVQLALADFDGTAPFTEVLDAHGVPDAGLAHLAAPTGLGTVDVPVARLDSLCDGPLRINVCTFLKIDARAPSSSCCGGRLRSWRRAGR